MAVEGTPWAVDGAKHSAAVARTDTYANSGGAEGIVGVGDLLVQATPTPSGQVRVAPGAIKILNRAPNGGQQTYTARNVSQTLVNVTPTGSSGGRTDYVWAHIIDPEYTGQVPANPAEADYFFLTCSASQPEGNGWYQLARINIPANTATITQAMITSLRKVANPLRDTVPIAFQMPNLGQGGYTEGIWSTEASGGEYWPEQAGDWRIDVPDYATRAIIRVDWSGVKNQTNKNSWGTYWVEYGYEYRRDQSWPENGHFQHRTSRFSWDAAEGNIYRTNFLLRQEVPIPPSMRGRRCGFVTKAGIAPGADPGAVFMDRWSHMYIEIEFLQVAITSYENQA